MISIIRATELDYQSIVDIGKISVPEAHKNSAPAEDLDHYIRNNYSGDAIRKELKDSNNIYHILLYNELPVGFSKIVLNSSHPNIAPENVTKLDRIYLLKEFQGKQLGLELLNFNIELAISNNQSGMWLFTWIGNSKAIDFYLKAGFKVIGSHKFYVTETHFNMNHHMYLDLTEKEHITARQ